MVTPDKGTPTSVYRYYDRSGALIYVGITRTGIIRNRQHNSDKEWWPYVASQRVDHYDTPEQAHAKEIALIHKYRPPFNKQHNCQYHEIHAAYLLAKRAGIVSFDPAAQSDPSRRKFFAYLAYGGEGGSYAEYRTNPENADVVSLLKHTWDADVRAEGICGKLVGKVSAIENMGVIARIHVAVRKGWRLGKHAEVLTRPIAKKGCKDFEIKIVIAELCQAVNHG